MCHPKIASTGEPWFLLPLCYMRKKEGVFASYGHNQSVNALRRIEMDCSEEFIDTQIRSFAKSIYKRYAKNNEHYFLDKTPRYYNVLDDLVRIFPQARFIVLLRNPVSIFASSLEAFRCNSLRRLDHLDNDFYEGPNKIFEFIQKYGDRSCIVKYESIITSPEKHIQKICSYLEIEYNRSIIDDSFQIDIPGHGDHLGAKTYNDIANTKCKWEKLVTTFERKRRFKKVLFDGFLKYMQIGGYDAETILNDIKKKKVFRVSMVEYLYLLEENFMRVCKRIYKKI